MFNAWHLLWIVPVSAFIGLLAEGLLKEADNNQENDSENSKWK